MKRSFSLIAAIALAGFCRAQDSTPAAIAALNATADALYAAKTLSTTVTSQTVDSAPKTFRIFLSKPNKLRFDTPTSAIVADGNNIITLDKARNVYVKQAQTPELFHKVFDGDEIGIFKGFFFRDEMNFGTVRKAPSRLRHNMKMDVLEIAMGADVDARNRTLLRLFIDPQDHLARQAEMESTARAEAEGATLIDFADLTVNGAEPTDGFAFHAPDGAQELSVDDFNADKWYTDLDEAKAVAARTHKKLLIFVYSKIIKKSNQYDRKIFATSDFRSISKDWVFLKVDAARVKKFLKDFEVKTVPTVIFADSDAKKDSDYTADADLGAFLQAALDAKKAMDAAAAGG